MLVDKESAVIPGGDNFLLKAGHAINYPIIFRNNLFALSNLALSDYLKQLNTEQCRVFVVIDHNVELIYGQMIREYFAYYNIVARYYVITVSEEAKNIDIALDIIKHLDEFHLTRRCEPLIAIGGGVVTDIAGFVASVYRRGISCIRIPTTLIGLIDAGIGVKTGINFLGGKNRIGSYYAPLAVFLDREFLKSLDDRLIANGVAEIIKLALVRDSELFFLLERHKRKLLAQHFCGELDFDLIISRAVGGMLEELSDNICEAELERKVDFGHTFSSKIEMQLLGEIYHGEAVAIDMAFSIILSQNRGLISIAEQNRTLNLLRDFNLPVYHKICSFDFMQQALAETTIHRDGLQRLPLINGIGDVRFVNDINHAEISLACDILQGFVYER